MFNKQMYKICNISYCQSRIDCQILLAQNQTATVFWSSDVCFMIWGLTDYTLLVISFEKQTKHRRKSFKKCWNICYSLTDPTSVDSLWVWESRAEQPQGWEVPWSQTCVDQTTVHYWNYQTQEKYYIRYMKA